MPPLHSAASVLGWHGVVLSDVPALGRRVFAVVSLRHDVHQWRMHNGCPPRSDPSCFKSGAHDRIPPPAVDLLGTLVTSPLTDRALHACGTLMTLAPCAVVLPEDADRDPWRLAELNYYGVGVVSLAANESVLVVLPPENRSTEFGPSPFGRWLLEVLYGRLLETTLPSAASASESTSSEPAP